MNQQQAFKCAKIDRVFGSNRGVSFFLTQDYENILEEINEILYHAAKQTSITGLIGEQMRAITKNKTRDKEKDAILLKYLQSDKYLNTVMKNIRVLWIL